MSKLQRGILVFTFLTVSTFAWAGVPPEPEVGADLVVGKSGPEIAAADSDVTYVITLQNAGPEDAPDVALTDTIPAGMTFVSATQDNGPAFSCDTTVTCTIALFPIGASAQFTFVFHIDADTPPGTFFINSATATTKTSDPNEENNTAIAVTSTPPPPIADLGVQKNAPAAAGPGTDFNYTITVTNAGPDAASDLTLEDILPGTLAFVSIQQTSGPALTCDTPAVGDGGTVTCTADTFPSGVTATLIITVHVPSDTQSGTSFTNTVTVASPNDPTEENNQAGVTTVVTAVDVSVTKTKTGAATADAGTNITYTIVVANAGPDFANVSLIDPLPAGTTFVSITQDNGPPAACGESNANCTFNLPAGTSAQFTYVVTADGSTSSVTNTATVMTEQFDTDSSDNQASVTTPVNPIADLSVIKSGPANVTAGTNATYTITITNDGPSAAANVTLTDVLPANTTFVSGSQTSGPAFACTFAATISCSRASLADNATATFSVTVLVAGSAANASSITNTADAASTTLDPDNADRTSSTTATVVATADVSVTKTGPATIIASTDITYNVSVTNSGPSNAASVTLTDPLPADTTFVSAEQLSGPAFTCTPLPPVGGTGTITCTAASMAPGTATFRFVFHVSPTATGPLTNTASVSSPTDTNGGNNSSGAATTVFPPSADVEIAKSASGSTFAPGSSVTYTIVVTNIGSFAAQATEVTDTLPAQLTLTSATSTQGTCTNTSPVVCTIGTLEPATSATITIEATIAPAASGGISNTATVTAANDINPANNSSTASISAAGASIPTLSEWALLMLTMVFAAAGMLVLRK